MKRVASVALACVLGSAGQNPSFAQNYYSNNNAAQQAPQSPYGTLWQVPRPPQPVIQPPPPPYALYAGPMPAAACVPAVASIGSPSAEVPADTGVVPVAGMVPDAQLFPRRRAVCPPSPCPAPTLPETQTVPTTPFPAPTKTPETAPSKSPEATQPKTPETTPPKTPETTPTTPPTTPSTDLSALQPESSLALASSTTAAVNMMGDLITNAGVRCVMTTRTITLPVQQTFTLPPITVTPSPFIATTAFVQPPPITVQPPPFRLPNGTIVTPPPFKVTPPPISFPIEPQQYTPGPFTVTPPPITVPGQKTITVEQQVCVALAASAARASSFKIAEDESVMPVDRVYFGFNYFDNVNEGINARLGGFANEDAYRETFGIEKTFLDGRASIELRVPLGTLDVNSDFAGLASNDTDFGDLSVGLKYALFLDRQTGNVVSAGFVVTAPTGPTEFNPFHSTILQPWLGYRWGFGDFFVQEFCSLAVPTTSDDVTLLFNDIELGYFLYRNNSSDALISAVIPTFEVHVNTPLNHRGAFRIEDDPAATPDWVTLTMGTTFIVGQRATVAIGGAVPVTGPKPYDFEILAQLNWRF
jgi:Putative MetA-pathway of phenol degradation